MINISQKQFDEVLKKHKQDTLNMLESLETMFGSDFILENLFEDEADKLKEELKGQDNET